MKQGSFSALIIGCGKIGAFWDKPGPGPIITHAHAYHANPEIGRLGFVDRDRGAAERAAVIWGGTAFPDLEAALAAALPEVASVCTPDPVHYEVLDRLLRSEVRLILAEKPLTCKVAEAEDVMERGRERGKILSVNYSRRFDPSVARVRASLRRGEFGKVLNAVGCYAKGILHNGSHLIDLLRHLFGEVEASRVLSGRKGHGEGDPTLDCWLRMQGCPSVHLVGLDEDSYSVHELDIFCERGRIRFTRFGFYLESYSVTPDPVLPGYRELSAPEIGATGLVDAMKNYLGDGLDALRHGREPMCPAADAARTLRACQGLLEQYREEDAIG